MDKATKLQNAADLVVAYVEQNYRASRGAFEARDIAGALNMPRAAAIKAARHAVAAGFLAEEKGWRGAACFVPADWRKADAANKARDEKAARIAGGSLEDCPEWWG